MRAMNLHDPLGLFSSPGPEPRGQGIELVQVQRPLRRVLAFAGHSIDEVCENPIVKNKVYAYFKLHKQIERWDEIAELERQWNPLGRRR